MKAIKKDFKHAVHACGRWCEPVHYVKESMYIFATILQLLVHINTPRMLSSQEPGQLTLVKCAISFSFPEVFIALAFFYPLLGDSCSEILLRIQGIQNYSLRVSCFIHVLICLGWMLGARRHLFPGCSVYYGMASSSMQ